MFRIDVGYRIDVKCWGELMESKELFLSEVNQSHEKILKSEMEHEAKGIYPCPCCGHHTLPVPKEETVAYICPVCYWENDVFTSSDDEPSDENHGINLNEGRRNYKLFGACSQDMLIHVRKPKPEECQESG